MGQFLKFLLASCLGVFLAMIAIGGISALVFAQMAMQADKPPKISPNTVLHITLDDAVPEKTNNIQMPVFELKNQDILGLHDLKYVIETAREDDNIKGIFLDVDMALLGNASARNLRQSILDFRESGKFVLAHSNYYTQGAYYLVSAADSVYLNPAGMVDFRGLAAQVPFFKNMLDKVGVKMEIFYAGKFKSATEPYRRTEMSKENKLQVREYLNNIYDQILADISRSRQIPVAQLRQLADEFAGSSDRRALETGLVDRVAYEDEVLAVLRQKLGLEEDEKIKTIKPEKYFLSNPPDKNYSVKNKIAVIYAEGTLTAGKETPGVITEDHYVSMIRKIRKDDKVKAIVLRVNSPGGSAITSENIWRELKLAKADGLPVLVSMGDVAASGGYMISAMSDSIFVETNTLTGSIGVFGMVPTMQELLNDKIGISFDTVLTNDLAAGFTPFNSFSEKETRIMQNLVNEAYQNFLELVAEGRGKTPEEIHEIAQGRVWTGPKAVEIGLADRVAGLEEVINSAAKMADVEEFRTVEYPKVKDPLQQLLSELLEFEQAKVRQQEMLLQKKMGEWYPYYSFLQEVTSTKGAQARLPFLLPVQ